MAKLYPCSPRNEVNGLPYFARLCEKIRLFSQGDLHPELHANLGKGMDLWTCQFFGVDYEALKAIVLGGSSDEEAYAWASKEGLERDKNEKAWFRSYLLNRGYRDDMSEKLAMRIEESGFQDRNDIETFCDYIDADEGRL